MVYKTTFDLVKALAEADPSLSIASDAGDLPYGLNVHVTSMLLPEGSDQHRVVEEIVRSAVSDNLIGYLNEFGTGDLELYDFRLTDGRLEATESSTMDRHNFFYTVADAEDGIDVLMGEEDVWGKNIKIEGISDFNALRDPLSAWGEVEFYLVVNQNGWEQDRVELVAFDDVEIEHKTRRLIESHLPALNSALQERYKSIAMRILEDTGADQFEWDSGEASEPGITITEGYSFSGTSVYSVGEESLRYLFNYACNCEIEFKS